MGRQRLLRHLVAWPTPNAPQKQCIHGKWGGIQASKKIKPRSGSHKNALLHRSVEMALVYMYWRTYLLAGEMFYLVYIFFTLINIATHSFCSVYSNYPQN